MGAPLEPSSKRVVEWREKGVQVNARFLLDLHFHCQQNGLSFLELFGFVGLQTSYVRHAIQQTRREIFGLSSTLFRSFKGALHQSRNERVGIGCWGGQFQI